MTHHLDVREQLRVEVGRKRSQRQVSSRIAGPCDGQSADARDEP